MKGRTGFIMGVGVGYVLAVKATKPPGGQRVAPLVNERTTAPIAIEVDADSPSKTQHLIGRGLRAASEALRNSG